MNEHADLPNSLGPNILLWSIISAHMGWGKKCGLKVKEKP